MGTLPIFNLKLHISNFFLFSKFKQSPREIKAKHRLRMETSIYFTCLAIIQIVVVSANKGEANEYELANVLRADSDPSGHLTKYLDEKFANMTLSIEAKIRSVRSVNSGQIRCESDYKWMGSIKNYIKFFSRRFASKPSFIHSVYKNSGKNFDVTYTLYLDRVVFEIKKGKDIKISWLACGY